MGRLTFIWYHQPKGRGLAKLRDKHGGTSGHQNSVPDLPGPGGAFRTWPPRFAGLLNTTGSARGCLFPPVRLSSLINPYTTLPSHSALPYCNNRFVSFPIQTFPQSSAELCRRGQKMLLPPSFFWLRAVPSSSLSDTRLTPRHFPKAVRPSCMPQSPSTAADILPSRSSNP